MKSHRIHPLTTTDFRTKYKAIQPKIVKIFEIAQSGGTSEWIAIPWQHTPIPS